MAPLMAMMRTMNLLPAMTPPMNLLLATTRPMNLQTMVRLRLTVR